ERDDLAALQRRVARQRGERRLPFARSERSAQRRDRSALEVLGERRQEVALVGERNEVEAAVARDRLDAEGSVGAAAGDRLRDGAVRGLDAVVAVDRRRLRSRRDEQLVEGDAGAC